MSDVKANSKRLNLVIAASAVLIILIIVLITQLNKPSSDSFINQQLSLPVNTLDYNIQNSLQSKLLGATDEYLFYSNDNNALFRINKDGSNKIELDKGKITNLNVYKDNLFYTKPKDANKAGNEHENTTYSIIMHPINGGENTIVTNMECQRIDSILVTNDIIICKVNIFEATGGLNDQGNPLGKVKSEYKAFSLDGKKSSTLTEENFNTLTYVNNIFSQAELDSLLEADYPDVTLLKNYVISDKQYFAIRTFKSPHYSAVFNINTSDRKPVLITKHTPEASEGTVISTAVLGFAYSKDNLYYILLERVKVNNEVQDKMNLYKIDTTTDTSTLVGNIL